MPKSKCASATLSWLETTLTSVTKKFLNPLASTLTLYKPGIRLGNEYVPAEVAVILTDTPVS